MEFCWVRARVKVILEYENRQQNMHSFRIFFIFPPKFRIVWYSVNGAKRQKRCIIIKIRINSFFWVGRNVNGKQWRIICGIRNGFQLDGLLEIFVLIIKKNYRSSWEKNSNEEEIQYLLNKALQSHSENLIHCIQTAIKEFQC